MFQKIINWIEKASAIAGAFSKVSRSLIDTTRIAEKEYTNIKNTFKNEKIISEIPEIKDSPIVHHYSPDDLPDISEI